MVPFNAATTYPSERPGYHPHFADDKVEAPGQGEDLSKSRSWEVGERRFRPAPSDSEVHTLVATPCPFNSAGSIIVQDIEQGVGGIHTRTCEADR